MRTYFPVIVLALAAMLVVGCDTAEDPNLLNPPLPDSTSARVVNLVDGTNVDLSLAGLSLTSSLAPLRVTDYRKVLFSDRIQIAVNRGARRDTLLDQTVPKASRVTYFVLSGSDTGASMVLTKQTSAPDSIDMVSRKVSRVVFINAVPSTTYLIKSGCQSGDTMFQSLPFSSSASIDTNAAELSLYLFASQTTMSVATARLTLSVGAVTYLVAARAGGVVKLYALTGSGMNVGGALPLVTEETRTTAQVALLNAVSDSVTISATLQGSAQPIATALASLQISPASDIPVCVNPAGDSLSITAAGGGAALLTPIRLSVGRRALVVVYDNSASARAIVLNLGTNIQQTPGTASIRAVNLSPEAGAASIAIGAGAPMGVSEGYRPFGTLGFGAKSNYVELPYGLYPIALSDGRGAFLSGGLQNLAAGYYTLFIISRGGVPALLLLKDDAPGTLQLTPLGQAAQRVLLFNMMPDTTANFSAGTIVVPPIPYSYVATTVLPLGTTSIISNAGTATVDLRTGSYIVGATGSGTGRQVMALRGATDSVPAGKAMLRCLNAEPTVAAFSIHQGAVSATPLVPLAGFAVATASIAQEQRKYSFLVTLPGDTAVQARVDGVEMISGRRYLLVIGPNKTGSASKLKYATLWMQE